VHTGVWSGPEGSEQRAGLQATAAALAELEREGWLLLHDLHRPGRRFASIDHVAVGPGGVVVIETKQWAGAVDVLDGVLHQNGVRRDRECALAQASAAAVTAWLEPGQRTAVHPLIALIGQPTPDRQPSATAVYAVEDVPAALRALPVRLGEIEIQAVADLLRRTLAAGSVPAQLTTASLETAMLEAAKAPVVARSWLESLGHRLRRNLVRRTPG
jgi:Nuclease-related domain